MKMESTFRTEKDYFLNSLLVEKLLTDKYAASLLKQTASGPLCVRTDAPFYFLLSVSIKDVYPGYNPRVQPLLSGNDVLFREIPQRLQSLFRDEFDLWPCVPDGDLFFLAAARGVGEKDGVLALERLYRKCMSAYEHILESDGVGLLFLIGESISVLEDLHTEFSRIRSIDPGEFYPRKTMGPVNLLREQDRIFFTPEKRDLDQLRKLEQQLCRAAALCDFDKVYQLFCYILDLEQRTMPAKRNIFLKARDRMSMVFSLAGIPYFVRDCPEIAAYYWRIDIMESITVEDLKSNIYCVLMNCKNLLAEEKESPAANVIEESIRYIEDHCTDPNLSGAVLSEKFDINISTFSRQFKEHTGVKYIDFLHRCRVDKAKRLMVENPYIKVEDIATMTGYQNITTFNRAFKRLEGETAGVWRLKLSRTE